MYMMNDREFSNRKETLHGEFYENALKYPERIALIYENEKVSYKMLRLYALRAANYMWQRGVRRNDKIVVILPERYWTSSCIVRNSCNRCSVCSDCDEAAVRTSEKNHRKCQAGSCIAG